MRLMSFNVVAEYAPGKTLLVTDTLPGFAAASTKDTNRTDGEVAFYGASVFGGIPAATLTLTQRVSWRKRTETTLDP